MINACSACGIYRADKRVDRTRSVVICPECAHESPFRFRPLLAVGGPSGCGKTAVLLRIASGAPPFIALESDIFWRPEFDTPDDGYSAFFELLLRTAKNINQSDRTAVVFGAGCATVSNLECRVERRYFTDLHVLAMVASDEAIESRLRARPEWRAGGSAEFIRGQLSFARAIRDHGENGNYTILDTTNAAVEETSAFVRRWIESRVEG